MNAEPIATYRVQLTGDFTLFDAAELAPYLRALGIDHLYTSPSQQAAPNSTSGYDVIDPDRVSEELGGQAGHDALSRALAEHGLRRMADIVPNHMAIGGGNPWWYSVLKHGQSSRHADWFDVDWDASEQHWPNRVLLPVLGEQFGRVLEAGELRLQQWEGQFTLHYYDNTFPVEPSSTAGLLARVAENLEHAQLGFYAESLRRLPRPSAEVDAEVERRHRDQAVLSQLLARLCQEEPAVREAIGAEVERLNGNLRELGELIEAQNYRLAHWRAADLDLGYRRFFNINTLAGLRVELSEVFAAVHGLPLQWLRTGAVHALRVDHPDGLRDPGEYLMRLRKAAPASWIVIEKILEPGEKLPASWPVDGTTGYDFGQLVQGLFVDPGGEDALTRCYSGFVGQDVQFEDVLLASKRCVLSDLLGSEVARLTSLLWNICERHWRHRDFTRAVYAQVIAEIAVGFEVYRTYARPGMAVALKDREYVQNAVAKAAERNPQLDRELLQFVERLLLLEVGGRQEEEFAMRFQQLTGPAMAKGLEDTAFYRYLRLAALNEVGGSPAAWATSPEAFHAWCGEALRERPYSLLATSTHDSKRSEDVRARLIVLSELPDLWAETVRHWHALHAGHRGARVDANTEYLFYQSVVGAWPVEAERMQAYMEKAVREAKVHTEWTRIDDEYELQLREFVAAAMASKAFMDEVERLVAVLQPNGRINSLAQTLIKLTAPGVPDIYQGCELWCHSLVDPDNRRPVDFALRQRLIAELDGMQPEAIVQRMSEGLPKLWLIREALSLRRAHPEWFGAQASYDACIAEGEHAAHVFGYFRGGVTLTLVPRLLTGLKGEPGSLRRDWGNTRVTLPPGSWRNRLDPAHTLTGQVELNALFRTIPLALLVKEV